MAVLHDNEGEDDGGNCGDVHSVEVVASDRWQRLEFVSLDKSVVVRFKPVSKCLLHFTVTVEPVLSGHPWGLHRWPLNTGWPLNAGPI